MELEAAEQYKNMLEVACEMLAAIAVEHLKTRTDNDRCGICRTRWPCWTYKIAVGKIE